jgi:hypothetical protein
MKRTVSIFLILILIAIMAISCGAPPAPFGAKNILYEPSTQLLCTVTDPASPDSGDPVRVGFITGIAETDENSDGLTTVNFGTYTCEVTVYAEIDDIIAGTPLFYSDRIHGVTDNYTTAYFFGQATSSITCGDDDFAPVIHLYPIPPASYPYYD